MHAVAMRRRILWMWITLEGCATAAGCRGRGGFRWRKGWGKIFAAAATLSACCVLFKELCLFI